jgi:hypothetical protein
LLKDIPKAKFWIPVILAKFELSPSENSENVEETPKENNG